MYADNLFTLNNVSTLPACALCDMVGAPRREEMTVIESDVVFVSVVQYGRIVFEGTFSGFADVKALLRGVMTCLGRFGGLATVSLRNRRCGQSMKRVMRLGRTTPAMPAMA